MTGVELALLLLGLVMVAGGVWAYRKTHSTIVVTVWVLGVVALAWYAGLLV